MLEKIFAAKDKIFFALGVIALVISIILWISTVISFHNTEFPDIPTEYTVHIIEDEPSGSEETPSESVEVFPYTDEEIELLAKLLMAEAGNQSDLGKRLVVDTVLNRVDHPNFPDTIYDVVYQKNQFSPATYGTIDLYSPTDVERTMVREEMERRTESNVYFFRAGDYGKYGVPLYRIGDHYFSSYD